MDTGCSTTQNIFSHVAGRMCSYSSSATSKCSYNNLLSGQQQVRTSRYAIWVIRLPVWSDVAVLLHSAHQQPSAEQHALPHAVFAVPVSHQSPHLAAVAVDLSDPVSAA